MKCEWCLCTVDGSLFIPTDKASFMHAVEDAKAEPPEDAPQPKLIRARFISQSSFLLVVVYDNVTKAHDFDEEAHTHMKRLIS